MATFIPSTVFNGKRMGYMFKNGNKGIGYYLDSQQQQQSQQISTGNNGNEYSSTKKEKDSVNEESSSIKESSLKDVSKKRSRVDDNNISG